MDDKKGKIIVEFTDEGLTIGIAGAFNPLQLLMAKEKIEEAIDQALEQTADKAMMSLIKKIMEDE